MSQVGITWDKLDEFSGEIAATLALDRDAWERAGARFAEVDDGNGESPGLATGTASSAGGETSFGVLDYGESASYVLVPGAGRRLAVVLRALAEAHVIRLPEDVLETTRGHRRPDARSPGAGTTSGSKKSGDSRRRTGTVKSFDVASGRGYITPDDGGRDIFFERRGISPSERHTLKAGDRVAFDDENDENRAGGRDRAPHSIGWMPGSS